MTEKQEETCENCGHAKSLHIGKIGCTGVLFKTGRYDKICPCKKFVAKKIEVLK